MSSHYCESSIKCTQISNFIYKCKNFINKDMSTISPTPNSQPVCTQLYNNNSIIKNLFIIV